MFCGFQPPVGGHLACPRLAISTTLSHAIIIIACDKVVLTLRYTCKSRNNYINFHHNIFFYLFSQLQKLKGRRNRHEEINIVDVNAADQIGNSAEMVAKYGTEETVHRPSRVKAILYLESTNTAVFSFKRAESIYNNFLFGFPDWLEKLLPLSQPIRSKTETNLDRFLYVFARA